LTSIDFVYSNIELFFHTRKVEVRKVSVTSAEVHNNNTMVEQPTLEKPDSTYGSASCSTSHCSSGDSSPIYYFGYGPIVNDLVRKRRGIKVSEIQAAYVPDYRLTFAIGGMASIVHRVGFEVHGLLMKLESNEDWEKICKFETGNRPTTRSVIPYCAIVEDVGGDGDSREEGYHNVDNDFHAKGAAGSIEAYLIEHPENIEDSILDAPMETLPQERYLKLIAEGMRQYRVDEDYVHDHIEACPFIPSRSPDEWLVFPSSKRVSKISMAKYEKICARGSDKGETYFCLGTRVFRLSDNNPAMPLATWLKTHGHGKACCTFMIATTVVDPSVPFLNDESDSITHSLGRRSGR